MGELSGIATIVGTILEFGTGAIFLYLYLQERRRSIEITNSLMELYRDGVVAINGNTAAMNALADELSDKNAEAIAKLAERISEVWALTKVERKIQDNDGA